MEGAQMTVTVGPAVAEVYGNMTAPKAGSDPTQAGVPQLFIVKSTSPVASSTQVSVKQLQDYLLSVPAISPELTKAIKALDPNGPPLPSPPPFHHPPPPTPPV